MEHRTYAVRGGQDNEYTLDADTEYENAEFPNGTKVRVSSRGRAEWLSLLPATGIVVSGSRWVNLVYVVAEGKENTKENRLALYTDQIEKVQ